MCGRTVGRLRVVVERETTNLCVPSSSSSFSASYSTSSSSSSSRYSSSLSLRLLRVSTGCFSLSPSVPTYYPLYLPSALSFSVVHPSTTLAGHPPSPFSVPLSFFRSPFARSLARSPPLPPCPSYLRAHPPRRSPSPSLSPSVCLASSFPSFIPSHRAPSSPRRSVLL